jgi:hypothetical protein
MYRLTHRRILSLLLGFPIACGSSSSDGTSGSGPGDGNGFVSDDDGLLPGQNTTLKAASFAFPGAGTSQAALPLTAGLGPETSDECNPEAVAGSSATIEDVQTICFYGDDEPDAPAAAIEQVVEVIGTEEWVHIRLTLNPDFVDNTYGAHAIGWGDAEAAATAPGDPGAIEEGPAGPGAPPGDAPPPPDAPDAPPPVVGDAGAPLPPDAPPTGDAPPPPDAPPPVIADAGAPPAPDAPPPRGEPGEPGPRGDGPGGGGPGGAGRGGRGGHTFRDLVGSDHAEMQILDADGNVAVQFKLDYLSASETASSGFESLEVSGGEGKLIIGDEAMILASATSMDRNLEACGLSGFLEDSPATDAAYTPNPDAAEWDFRASYEVWISADAFGSAGFGSALIELVHASPSKLAGDSVDVTPAPCPADPENPELAPQPLPQVLSNLR